MKANCLLSFLLFLVFLANAQNKAAYFDNFSKYYRCGNIGITGDKLTVEALIKLNGTGPFATGMSAHDIVSKHHGSSDATYLLRPYHCQLTTTNGFYYTDIKHPSFSKDSFYHVAMTYDGSLLKFYVNGCVFSQIPATGNVVANNYITTIGQLASSPESVFNEQFFGYIDEVRIWSVARTQDEIKSNMHDLPFPNVQTGLLAYYKFDGNSKNIQGNSAFDAEPFNNPKLEIQDGFSKVKPFLTTFSSQQPSCDGTGGAIIVGVQGGKAPYKYSLDGTNFQSSNVFNSLRPGSYTVFVSADGSGCQQSQTFLLKDPTPNLIVDSVKNIDCAGTNGAVYFKGTGDYPPFQYSLNGGVFQNVSNFSNLAAGVYSLRIMGANGCIKDTSITINRQNCSTDNCSYWLKLPSQPSYVRVGDLDIPGNKLTVEATFNRTAPWNGSDLFQGDLVSKHEDSRDCNYLLRPGSAEITTNNGYFKTPTICNIELNKTYHAAMVYDGATLKFYRNGYLMSQIAASGNLIQNNWQTQIGLYFNQITQENFFGYINEVRIWNTARTQAEIRSLMDKPIPSPQSTPGLLAYYTFDNLINKQGNPAWNGTVGGNASINQPNPNCNFIADSCNVKVCDNLLKPEFSLVPDLCSPMQFRFIASLKDVKSYQWDFGNGQTANGPSASVAYTTYSTYPVKLKVQYENGCMDSVSKQIPADLTFDFNLISRSDTTICSGDTLLLNTSIPNAGLCWKDGISSINSTSTSIAIAPRVSTTYTLNLLTLGTNLLTNGDFNSGTNGFSSGYTLSSSGQNAGAYFVGSSVVNWNSGMSNCTDQTSGSGNMMLVNGSQQQNVKVWSQTVPVSPNTNYAFSTWLQSLSSISPARLQFSVNGQLLDNVFAANANSCVWEQFQTVWNSGASPTATLSIISMNQDFAGNDFALDDLFFGQVAVKTDIVKISVTQRPGINTGADITICKDSTIQLNSNVATGVRVQWQPPLYLNDPISDRPTARPMQTITYIAEATYTNGCSAKDTIAVTVLDKPTVSTVTDTTICQGEGILLNNKSTGATKFSWTPAVGISDPASANPIVSPVSSTTYLFTAGNDGCYVTNNVHINVNPLPFVSISEDTTVCENSNVQLYANGGTTYEWFPAFGLSSSTSANPIASVTSGTKYYVTAKGVNGCSVTDSVQLSVFPKPVFNVVPINASVCLGDTVVLRASGADQYKWSPGPLVFSQDSSVVQAIPNTTTQYKVIFRSLACNIQESLFTTVQVHPNPTTVVTKSNDIDCSNFQAQLNASGGTRYNWTSSAGLSSTSIANPVASPMQTTTYSVLVTSSQGCSTLDSITVKVDASGLERLFVPSAFSPNNDGKNDCFGVRYWGQVKDFSLEIFDRWGQKVFTSTSTSDCWNGRYKGADQPAGVFVYMIRGKSICGDIYKRGIVTLIR